jgi:hypothetical protein
MGFSVFRTIGSLSAFANWVAFLTVTLLIGEQAGDFAWIYKLHWGSFLTDLSGLFQLTAVPSGSVWIAWLLLSVCFSIVWLGYVLPKQVRKKVPSSVSALPPDPVDVRQGAIESRPEIQEKLKRLNRWLS